MDSTDTQILSLLRQNARLSAAAIARQVNLSVPAVLERMKKLRISGVIGGYTIRVDRPKTGLRLLAFVAVRLAGNADIGAFRALATAFPCVLECHHIAGEYDYLLKVAAEDTAALERFLSNELKRIGGVSGTNTQIVLATLKEE